MNPHKLKIMLENKGLRYKDFFEKCGVSKSTFYRFTRNGKMTKETEKKIKEGLDIVGFEPIDYDYIYSA
jgi:predicted DNA-binding transcriptional regulator AlpA